MTGGAIVGGGAALLTPQGDPVPPQSVLQALQKISPRLTVEWVGGNHFIPGYFGLKERWRDDDPRWERVRTGEVPPTSAFDILTTFPRDVRTDDMASWVEARWGERGIVNDPVREAERMVEAAQKRLTEARAAGVERVVEQGTQRVLDETPHLRRVRAGVEEAHPMVSGASFAPEPAPAAEPKRLIEKAT